MDEKYTDLVTAINGQYGVTIHVSEHHSLYTTSVEVANVTGIPHKNVLRKIDDIIKKGGIFTKCFIESTYKDLQNQDRRCYIVTRDGFMKFIFSYKDSKMQEIQERYMSAFIKIESYMRNYLDKYEAAVPVKGSKEYFAEALTEAMKVLNEKDKFITKQNENIVALTASIKEVQDKNDELNKQAEDNKNLLRYANSIAGTDGGILVRELAIKIQQTSNQNGYQFSIGEKRLYKWLRDKKYISSSNLPMQKYVTMGLFTLKDNVITNGAGSFTKSTLLVTGKGQEYFITKFLDMLSKGIKIDLSLDA